MSTITTRSSKGSALSWAEMDANLNNLNTDKLESSALTPYLTSATAASTYETQSHSTSTYTTKASPTTTGTFQHTGAGSFVGSNGNVQVNAAGDQLTFTYNGPTYLTASGASATLNLNASGASGKVAIVVNGTEYFRITSTGAFGLSGANYGTSGQVLTSNGSASAPTWQTPSVAATGFNNLHYISGRYYRPEYGFTSTNTVSATIIFGGTSYIYLVPIYVRHQQLFSAISVCVKGFVASKSIRLGIYADSNGVPGTLLYDAGTASFASAGTKDVALSQTLDAGWYWLALVTDSTATGELEGITTDADDGTPYQQEAYCFGRTSLGSGTGCITHLRGTQAYGTLPSTLPSLTAITSVAPLIALKV